jgi:high affinity Mn2+ porin
MRPLPTMLFVGSLLGTAPAAAQVARPPGHADDAFDFMNLLVSLGLHDFNEERWNAYGQVTWISSLKAPFHAPYTNYGGSNMSLVPTFEHSFTGSATLYLGLRLWRGGEFYYVPEVITLRPLSHLRGIGGSIQNFELQKGGTAMPQVYRARAYFQQTFDLGGKRVWKSSDPMQLETTVDSSRLVVRVGNFSVLDFMDHNEFAGDLRQQFFNMAFMTYSAYDFGSDARGLAFGGVAEIYFDDWALRLGRVTPPQNPNELSVELRLHKFFGDQAELEHRHRIFGQAGAIRLLGYRNREHTGRFEDAIAAYQADPTGKNATTCQGYNYGSTNAKAPDLCWARKTNDKLGIGLSLEQHITDDLGVSFRGMVSDGKTEVYAYTPTDRSMAVTLLSKGNPWHRPRDLVGVGFAANWISSIHAKYLGMGGVDGFVGDGKIRQAPESVFEVFYSLNVLNSVWLSLDYQHLTNPAFNADRGPVEIFGGRMHAQF